MEYILCEGRQKRYNITREERENKIKEIKNINVFSVESRDELYIKDDTILKIESKKINIKHTIKNENGFEILTIWESEYKSNKELTIKKCLDFIKLIF